MNFKYATSGEKGNQTFRQVIFNRIQVARLSWWSTSIEYFWYDHPLIWVINASFTARYVYFFVNSFLKKS